MAERNENIEEMKRDKNKESQEMINDNKIINSDEKQNLYTKISKRLNEKGYNCEIISNGDIPQGIIVKNDKNELIAIYNDKEIQRYTNIQEEWKKLMADLGEVKNREQNVKMSDSNKKNNRQTSQNKEKQQDENKEEQQEENEKEQQKDNNDEKDEKNEKKDENNKEVKKEGELSKEEIQKQLGDKYVVAEIIVDEEISRELIGTQGFVGNPMIAYNKEEKKFEIVGNKGGGKLEKAKLPSIPASSDKVKKYNNNGELINEEKGNVSNELLLINGNKDGIELGVTDYGEIVLNKQLNVNDMNQQSRVSVPIDTKQKVPTTKEIDEMKENSDKTSELNDKLDNMETNGKISKEERQNLEKKFATDGKTVEENLEELKKIEKEDKEEKKDKEIESAQEIEQKEEEEEIDDSWAIYGAWRSH